MKKQGKNLLMENETRSEKIKSHFLKLMRPEKKLNDKRGTNFIFSFEQKKKIVF